MNVLNWKSAPEKKNPHGVDVRLLHDKPDAQALHIFLDAGEKLKPHITPVDVFFYVLEGKPTIMVGEESKDVVANDLVESPKNIPHCIYNETDQIARVLVVKTPRQKETSKVL
jgi:mannose-6-phosphate isomerase-like protein (cupin superfamily)